LLYSKIYYYKDYYNYEIHIICYVKTAEDRETIESITNKDKKKITKIAQSSAALEKEQNFGAENEIDAQYGILDTE
jgi:hypothetical protein